MSNRVDASGQLTPSNFADYDQSSTLVFCNIEGAELELLDPEIAPALKSMDIIVESHECLRAGITDALITRFTATHDIQLITDNGSRQLENATAFAFGPIASYLGVAVWTDTMASYAFKRPNGILLMNRARLERASISQSNVNNKQNIENKY